MLQKVSGWNENERRRNDTIVLPERKWMAGMITEEEYNNIVRDNK
jgi:hypothetical protein